MPGSRRAKIIAAAALCLLLAPAVAAAGPIDELGIEGEWSYQTRSNCGARGRGAVRFRRLSEGVYEERGWVYWPHNRLTVRWSGTVRFDPETGRLRGTVDNSLGDRVDADWRVVGRPAERLVVGWSQTNGCRGTGVATRPR